MVVANQLIEYFPYAIDCLRLQDRVLWRLLFLEDVATKDTDGGGDEDAAVEVLRGTESVHDTVNININGEIWVLLSQSRKDAR